MWGGENRRGSWCKRVPVGGHNMWIESSNVTADRYLCGGRYPTQHVRLDPNRIFRTRTHVHIPGRFGGTFPVQAFSIQKVVIKTSRVCLKHTFSANATSDACWTSIREDGCNGDAPSPAFHRQHRCKTLEFDRPKSELVSGQILSSAGNGNAARLRVIDEVKLSPRRVD